MIVDDTSGDYTVRAVARVCDVLDLLQGSPNGVTLREVSASTGLPKSSAFRYLWTLERRRYVERLEDDEKFRLGLAFLPLQARRLDVLISRARPYLERLRDEFSETINLGLLDGNRIIYLDIVESPHSMRLAARRGDRDPIHSTALGKAIAAHLKEEQARAILIEEGMPALTNATIVDVDAYIDSLEDVRTVGYAMDDGENEPDGRCVAVALGGVLPAAISLSAPLSRFPMDQVSDVVDALKQAANSLLGDFEGVGSAGVGGGEAD